MTYVFLKTPKVFSYLFLFSMIICGACSKVEQKDINDTQIVKKRTKHKTQNIISNCLGATALDTWAGFGGAGPEFVFNSGKKNTANSYFKGDIKKAKELNFTDKNKNTVDYMQDFVESNSKLLKFYQEIIPTTYLAMCEDKVFVNSGVSSFIANNTNKLVPQEDRWGNHLYISNVLLRWEIKAYNYSHSNNNDNLKALVQEIDSFTQSDDFFLGVLNNPSDFAPSAHSNTNVIRFALLRAKIRSTYAIKANSPIDMSLAYDTFFKIQAITQSDQSLKGGLMRDPIFSTIHRSAFSSYRFTAALNEYYIMQSITSEITQHPEWLQDPNEALRIYAKRISEHRSSYSNDLCPAPTQKEIEILLAEKKSLLLCQTPINIFRNTLKDRIVKHQRSENIFGNVLKYEDSPLIWAKNKFEKYKYYQALENISNQDRSNNLESATKWSIVRKCSAKKALEHARTIEENIPRDLELESTCN